MNIVVTGASRGIGYELVKKFIHHQHKVIAIARSRKDLLRLEEELKSDNFYFIEFDLSTVNYHEVLIPFVMKRFEKVDILINNAGLLINKPFDELTDNDFDHLFNINVKSAFKLTKALIDLFKKGAHIVNISSMGGMQGTAKFPGLSLYSASKAALAVLSECMAEELKGRNIRVNALALGAVQTEMLSIAFPSYKAPLKAHEMSTFIFDFAVNGQHFFNGKILPVALSTP